MKFLHRFKFRTQVSIGYSIVICFVFITIMLMMHMMLRDSYRTQTSETLQTHGKQIAINIDNRIDYFLSYMQLVSMDSALLRDMVSEPFFQVSATLNRVTREFMTLNYGRVNSINLYRNGIYGTMGNLTSVERLFADNFGSSAENPNAHLITGSYFNDRNEKVFSIFKRVFPVNPNRVYYIEMRVYETELFGFFNEELGGNGIYVFHKGKLMSMNDRGEFSKRLYDNQQASVLGVDKGSVNIPSDAILLEAEPGDNGTGFDILIQTNSSYLELGYRNMLIRMLPILLVVFFLSACFAQFLSARLQKRLKVLQEKIAAISNWKLTEDLHIDGRDEFGLLAHELDSTRQRILILIEQNNSINEMMRVAEMSALRAQINAHFLFNSLSSIRWLSRTGNSEDAVKAVDALALFLRYSLAFKENQVALRDEMKQLEVYLYLQKLRYGDEINIQTDVDDSLLSFRTVKLILQPLIENAIYHARREDNAQLNITVYSYVKGDFYYLVVEDDGNGISLERLETIRAGKLAAAQSGYGLKNVIERVSMCSNGQGEVEIESQQNVCTKITIKQPTEEF